MQPLEKRYTRIELEELLGRPIIATNLIASEATGTFEESQPPGGFVPLGPEQGLIWDCLHLWDTYCAFQSAVLRVARKDDGHATASPAAVSLRAILGDLAKARDALCCVAVQSSVPDVASFELVNVCARHGPMSEVSGTICGTI